MPEAQLMTLLSKIQTSSIEAYSYKVPPTRRAFGSVLEIPNGGQVNSVWLGAEAG